MWSESPFAPGARCTTLLCYCFLKRVSENATTQPQRTNGLRHPKMWAQGDSMDIQPAGRRDSFSSADQEFQEREVEARKIRRLQVMISMVTSVIGQDPSLTLEEAAELAAGAKRAALAMFPDKELAYDLIYKPRLQRLIRERFRLQ